MSTGCSSLEVGERVVEQLDDVLAAVGVGAWILGGYLVVVGGLEEARRPGGIAVAEVGFVRVGLAIGVAIDEEVGIGGAIVSDRRARHAGRVGLDRLVEQRAQPFDLGGDPFAHIAVAVIVDERAGHTHLAQVLDAGDARVAGRALVDFQLQRVRIVAADASIVPLDVGEVGLVGLARVLIAALGQRAVLGGGGSIVVDITEAQVGADGVFVDRGFLDGGVDAHRRLASLVALHAARLAAQARDLGARRHDDAGLGQRDVVVAGHTLDAVGRRGRFIDHASGRAIGAQEVHIAGGAVALSAFDGDFFGVLLIPVAERFGG